MTIYAFTPEQAKKLHAKTKSEPWLHVMYLTTAESHRDDKDGGYYIIYIWDTRKVVEEGIWHSENVRQTGERVKDNHQPLVGSSRAIQAANDRLKYEAGIESSGAKAPSDQVDRFVKIVDQRLKELVKLLAADARDCGIVNDAQRDNAIKSVASNFFK